MEEIWDEDGDDEINTEEQSVLSWQLCTILIFVLMWKFCFGVSDDAVTALLTFLSKFFNLTCHNLEEQSIFHHLSAGIPQTLHGAFHMVGVNRDNFIYYIVCQQCNSVFTRESGFMIVDGKQVPNTCPHVPWPNHSQPSKQLPCGAVLMKTIRSRTDNTYIQPFKVYPYQSLKVALQRLILRDKLLDICEHWRTRIVPPGYLYDIYDGQTWQDFLSDNGFFQSMYNLCLTINIDWFQPFSHTRKLRIGGYFICIKYCFIYYRIFCWCHISGDTKSASSNTLQKAECNTGWVNSRSQRA